MVPTPTSAHERPAPSLRGSTSSALPCRRSSIDRRGGIGFWAWEAGTVMTPTDRAVTSLYVANNND